MKAPWTLWRYVLRDMALYGLLAGLVLTLLVEVRNVLRFLDDLFVVGASFADLLRLSGVLLPIYLSRALPASLLLGVLICLGRMASDGEILAMRAGGHSALVLLAPALALGSLVAATSLYLNVETIPRSNQRMRELLLDALQPLQLIKEGRFTSLGSNTLFVSRKGDDTCSLEGVFLGFGDLDEQPVYAAARCGTLESAGETELVLKLTDGSIQLADTRPDHYRVARFSTLEARLDVEHYIHPPPRPRDYDMDELRARITDLAARPDTSQALLDARVEYHSRLATPLAALCFALVGVGLGFRGAFAGRSWGILFAIGVLAAYWVTLASGSMLAEQGTVPVVPAVWAANVLTAALGFHLLWGASRAEV